ncbi:MAG TPA: undecaprenyldiphospho-muramoylpentapeptide beta-N-acetylglucosaminyltransferase [Rheinheimera sp.]|nr:undecaprenyldiphospho-muramoylpentapeptide beta-N-acetylglucosaminyltransferase [Rheinheimera sp.]
MPNSTAKRALIMAGGTGGHIFPAKAVADQLAAEGWQIAWLGTADRMEAKLVPTFGYALHTIAVAGLRGKGLKSVLQAPLMLLKSLWQARQVVKKVQPDIVVGFGGYASGPGGVAAWLAGVPLIIHEQNAVAGTTNRLLARLAKRVLVAFPQAFAGHPKQQVTGNPVRSELIGQKPQNSCSAPLNILIVGGSLGARVFNQTLPAILKQAAACGPIAVRHQTGQHDLQNTQALYADAGENLTVQVTAFIEDMAQAYRWADLVICRAGALTVSEVACAGVAALFVPLPSAIDDHQTANAGWLSERGAALRVAQTDLTETFLLPQLQQWLKDKTPLQQMATQARLCAIDDATTQVVAVCRRFTGVNTQ